MTDCLNGTLITYNGKEFTLQNDFGNGIVESAKLKEGFIPIGLKEYGGIVYIVSHNPMTNESEFGSFPSPERNITSDDQDTGSSSGIGMIDITQTDFTSNGSVVTSSIKRDLMKPSDFELNPGDRFAIYYTNAANYNALISLLTSGSTRKYYKLRVAKLSESGIVYLNDINIYNKTDIAFDSDNVNYDVYQENTIGTIAIVMELETIDSFDFLINEKIISADPNNRIAVIKAYAKCASLVKFKGFKLNITDVQTRDIVYSKYLYLNKNTDNYNSAIMEFQLSGFDAEKEYSFEAIPFSQFNLYDSGELRSYIKTKNFVFGQQYATGNAKYDSSLFKYYVDNSNIKFNFNFNVNTAGSILGCYMELYDMWSNLSTLYRVNDYVNGLDSYVSFELNDNIAVQDLTATNICGIPLSEMYTFSEFSGSDINLQQCKPTLVSNSNSFQGDKLISKTNTLRRNHAYIVKISVIEKYNDANDVEIIKYNDIYRYVYTSGIFNLKYFDTSVKNMSLSNYDNIDVTYSLSNSSKIESLSTLNPEYTGDHTELKNIKYPYKIKLQSETTPGETHTYKSILKSQKESGVTLKYVLNDEILSKLFGVVNYSAISNVSIVNGTTSVTEIPAFVGNQSLGTNLQTSSNGLISNSSVNIDSNHDLDVAINVRCNTNRGFYATSAYNLANLRTINTNTWVSLYDKLHSTARENKVLVEFGIHKVYHSSSTSNNERIAMRVSGYTPEQTTTKQQRNDTNGDAIVNNPYADYTFSTERGGPTENRVRQLVEEHGIQCSGFIGKFVGNTYYALDTALGDRVAENEYVLMLRTNVNTGFDICPTPFMPAKTQFLYNDLMSAVRSICSDIVYVTKGNVSYIVFAPETNDICYHSQFQSVFKTSGQKITYSVQDASASNIVFLSNGTNNYVPYETSLIKNYINLKASQAEALSTSTLIFSCHEKVSSDYTSGITNSLVPKFIAASKSIDINIDDVIITPEVDTFQQNLYQQAKSYAFQDPVLVEVTTFPETGRLISEGLTAKRDEYVKYANLFEWKDNQFNYIGNIGDAYTSDATGDRFERKCPDLLIDFAK